MGLCVVVALGAFIYWPEPKEPEYEGRKLSDWCEAASFFDETKSAAAIRHIGTNALPFLMQWIKYRPSIFVKWECKVTDRLGYHKPTEQMGSRCMRSFYAQNGFKELGSLASPAVPELTKLLFEPKESAPGYSAAHVLVSLAESEVVTMPKIYEALANENANIRLRAVQALANVHKNRDPAVKAVTSVLDDPEPEIRRWATNTLKVLKGT